MIHPLVFMNKTLSKGIDCQYRRLQFFETAGIKGHAVISFHDHIDLTVDFFEIIEQIFLQQQIKTKDH